MNLFENIDKLSVSDLEDAKLADKKILKTVNSNKESLLYCAVKAGNVDIIDYLLENVGKAKINAFVTKKPKLTLVQWAGINSSFEIFTKIFEHKDIVKSKKDASISLSSSSSIILSNINNSPDANKKIEYFLSTGETSKMNLLSLIVFPRNGVSAIYDYVIKNNLFDDIELDMNFGLRSLIRTVIDAKKVDILEELKAINEDLIYKSGLTKKLINFGYGVKYMKEQIDMFNIDLSKFENLDDVLKELRGYKIEYINDVLELLVSYGAKVTSKELGGFLGKHNIDNESLNKLITANSGLMNSNDILTYDEDAFSHKCSKTLKLIFELTDFDVNLVFPDGRCALSYAVRHTNTDFMEYLISKGADVNFINQKNDKDVYMENRSFSLSLNVGDLDILKLLVENGFKHITRIMKTTKGSECRKSIFHYLIVCLADDKNGMMSEKEYIIEKYILPTFNNMTDVGKKEVLEYASGYSSNIVVSEFFKSGITIDEEYLSVYGRKVMSSLMHLPTLNVMVPILLRYDLTDALSKEAQDIFLF